MFDTIEVAPVGVGSTGRSLTQQIGTSDGLGCGECRKLYQARSNWRARHAGEPMPAHLLLRGESA